MPYLAIWIDTEEARIFRMTSDGVSTEVYHHAGPRHQDEVHGRNHPLHQTDEEKFLHAVALHLQNEESREWYIAGPGLARQHFENHLKRHHPELSKRVVANEKMNRASDDEIIAAAKKCFRHRQVFQAI